MILEDMQRNKWVLCDRLRLCVSWRRVKADGLNQVYFRHSELLLRKIDSTTSGPSTCVTLPDYLADQWIAGKIRVAVR
jgi:hypothetical protein